jgi:amidase
MTIDLDSLDAVAQAELVHSGELSPRELVSSAIARIERFNPAINAISGRAFDQALEKAESMRDQDKQAPFAGVPWLVKDVLSYPGLPLSLGSRLFAANIASLGSPYVDRLRATGLIPLGTTTSSEMGLLGSTETLAHGVTRNPWNLDRSATGSSGGSAAAVASGMVPIAHASDGGGSIRIPASVCGVFGLKPSRGRQAPAGPGFAYDLVVEHCVSRSVRDSALLLSLTEAPSDKFERVGFVRAPLSRRLRIGVYSTTTMGQPAAQGPMAALESTVALCRALGHEIVDAAPPSFDGPAISRAFFICAGTSVAQVANMMERMLGRAIGESDFEPFTLALIAWSKSLPESALPQAFLLFDSVSAQMRSHMSSFDVLLCPTLPIEPPELGFLHPARPFDELLRRTESLAGFTPIHNIAGLPAMSVPLFWSADGLPIGSHFAAPIGGEGTLLGLAYQLEEARPWANRRPVILGSSS